MRRRQWIACALTAAASALGHAQVADLNDAINKADRHRMLSQRMAKFYRLAALSADDAAAAREVGNARSEFVAATETLRNAPQANARIREELQLTDGQWVFLDSALRKPPAAASKRSLSEVFVASENLLAAMDRITEVYAAIVGQFQCC